MTEERVQRRLAAILPVDLVDYSRHMSDDEAGRRTQLKMLCKERDPKSSYRLRIPTKAATDSDLIRPLWPGVEFGVVIVAVGCSLDVIFVRRGQRRWR